MESQNELMTRNKHAILEGIESNKKLEKTVPVPRRKKIMIPSIENIEKYYYAMVDVK